VALFVVACGKSGGGDSAAPVVKIDPAAVNALVPAELKEKLVFEQREIKEERGKRTITYTVAGPKDWDQGGTMMFAKLKPKDSALFMTSFDVGTNCDGTCESKDWAKTSEKVEFAQFRDAKIIKDEVGKTSHLMIAEKGDKTYVRFASWTDGARRYATCGATLEAPIAAAADAFAKACEAMSIKGAD
jgi:hypothetical protein